jgi:hypothetical protein
MNRNSEHLFAFELDYLIRVLRRDIENERNKAAVRPESALYHLYNVRSSIRLLEAFGCDESSFWMLDHVCVDALTSTD